MKTVKSMFILWISLNLLGCGQNIFKKLDKGDAATDATLALEEGKPDVAISLLLSTLGDAYTTLYDALDSNSNLVQAQVDLNAEMEVLIAAGKIKGVPNLVSILASSKAQKHGIDPFSIALKFADSASSGDSSSSGSGNSFTVLFPVLPDATAENLEGLDIAMTILGSVGSKKTVADQYKEALLLTASIALVTKTLDADGDGEVSALEAVTLSDAAAKTLLNQITAAVLAAAANTDSDSSASSEQIQALQSKIDAEDGATQEEKLRNFMAKSGA
jgi:hypothetical protein